MFPRRQHTTWYAEEGAFYVPALVKPFFAFFSFL